VERSWAISCNGIAGQGVVLRWHSASVCNKATAKRSTVGTAAAVYICVQYGTGTAQHRRRGTGIALSRTHGDGSAQQCFGSVQAAGRGYGNALLGRI
jgi:hypothetical protein